MNIVLYQWKAYQYNAIRNLLQQAGHRIYEYTVPIQNPEADPAYVEALVHYLSQHPCDFVFSINYFPVLSAACMDSGLPYVCWTCDSPLIAMHHTSLYHPCNYIFVFDRTDYCQFQSMGAEHLFYLPLGTTVPENPEHRWKMSSPSYAVSFIGSLYEKNTYDQIAPQLPDYLRGYLDCAIEAQLQVTGGNLLYHLLTPEICEDLEQISDYRKSPDSLSDLQLLFATTILGFKAASVNRIRCLEMLSQALLPCRGKDFPVQDGIHLFTDSGNSRSDLEALLPLVQIHDAVDYTTGMPKVIQKSRINLHFTIPNIRTGLPLRIWDTLGSGGFLLSNEQAELHELLQPGKDLETFSSPQELIDKCMFYLQQDDLRQQIAAHGYQTVQQNYTCRQQLEKLLQSVHTEIL